MLKKTLMVATLGTALAAGTLSTTVSAQGDPLLGALVGGGIGAAIGHSVNGHNGAWVGGAVGALAGASIAANSGYYGGYYGPGHGAPAPAYYAPAAPYYYNPAPVYVAPPVVVYRPRPVYARPYYSGARYYGGYGSGYRNGALRALVPVRAPRTLRLSARSSTHVQPRHPAGLFFCVRFSGEGKLTRTRAPLLASRAPISSTPAWRSTISLTMARPSPDPSPFVPGIL